MWNKHKTHNKMMIKLWVCLYNTHGLVNMVEFWHKAFNSTFNPLFTSMFTISRNKIHSVIYYEHLSYKFHRVWVMFSWHINPQELLAFDGSFRGKHAKTTLYTTSRWCIYPTRSSSDKQFWYRLVRISLILICIVIKWA